MSWRDWSTACVCLCKKPQSFILVPGLHERRTVASSFVCTAVSLCGEALLFPTFLPSLQLYCIDRPGQVWTDVNLWLLSLTRGTWRNLLDLFLRMDVTLLGRTWNFARQQILVQGSSSLGYWSVLQMKQKETCRGLIECVNSVFVLQAFPLFVLNWKCYPTG